MAFHLFGKKNDYANLLPASLRGAIPASCIPDTSTEEKALVLQPKKVYRSCKSSGNRHVETIVLARKLVRKIKSYNKLKFREEILSNCITNCGKPFFAREFSKYIKIITLALQRTNVEAYKFLCELALPSNRQISRSLPIACGIPAAILQSISMQLPSMEKSDKLCALILDEISLTKRIEYSNSSDCFEGFSDIHGCRYPSCADGGLVLMACGLMSSWKQPICLCFTHLINEESIARAIEDCITSLLAVGLNIVAVVSNLRERTISAIDKLATRTFPEGDGLCMKFGTNKVFHFLDPWLIQEQMRDNCLKYSIKFKGKNGKMNITKIDALMEFLDKPKTDKNLVLISEFMSKLVGPEVQKNKESTDNNEKYFAGMFKNPDFMRIVVCFKMFCSISQNIEGLHLVEFINTIHNVFDAFNTDQKERDGIYRRIITPKSIHHKLLKEMRVVDKFEFLPQSPNDKEPNNKCFSFLKRNIVGLQSLWQMLHEQGFDKLQTVHLNLEPLLKFFDAFKQKAKNRKSSLSCKQFTDSFKLLVIESNIVDMSQADWDDYEESNLFDDDDDDDDTSQKHEDNVKLFAEFMKDQSGNRRSRLEFQSDLSVEKPSSMYPWSELCLCTKWCDDFTYDIDQEKGLARAKNLCASFLHTFYLSKPIYSCFSCFQMAIQCQCKNFETLSTKNICGKCKNPNLRLAKQMYQLYIKTLQNLRVKGYMSHLVSTLKLQFSSDLKRNLECKKHKDVLSDNILEFVVKEAIWYFSKRVNSSLLSLSRE